MKICVIGLGYIGLPTALLLAKGGHEVVGYDIDRKRIENLNEGILPFKEKGIDELYSKAKDNFKAVVHPESADAFLIAVPTPITDDKRCDLRYVFSAFDSVSGFIEDGNILILESTVKPGTSDILKEKAERTGKKIHFAYVSEKAIPGNTLHEMINNDRIIGAADEESGRIAKDIYSSFVEGEIILTSCKTAETVKLMENTFRDVNIALANEFSLMARKLGIDIKEAISLANKHPRANILNPGPGVGGHCIPIDPWFLIEEYPESKIMRSARDINDNMPNIVLKRIKEKVKGIEKPVISILGVAYKPNIDDYRESPSLKLIELCMKEGYELKINDPHVKTFPYELTDLDDALRESDCVVLMVGHDEYKGIDKTSNEFLS